MAVSSDRGMALRNPRQMRYSDEDSSPNLTEHREISSGSITERRNIDAALARPWELSSTDLVKLLEWAGAILLSMQLSPVKPKKIHGCWPEYVQNVAEAYGYTSERLRAAIPGAHDISCMETILEWINHIPLERYVLRRIVGARSLVNPVNQKHLFSWSRIGKMLSADRRAVRSWYDSGVDLIMDGLKDTRLRSDHGRAGICVDRPHRSVRGY